MPERCHWQDGDALYTAYHDEEWGRPLYDSRALFELLCLEGAQAGLSWRTVLHKRAHYRLVFNNFAPEKIAAYDDAKREALLQDAGIIRNRLKVNAFIENAKAYLRISAEQPFSEYLWQLAGGRRVHHFAQPAEIPPFDEIAVKMSKQLRKDGFRFVGPTTCYAFMQASGMVCDHLTGCPQHPDFSNSSVR